MDGTAVISALIALIGSVLAWLMGRMDRRLERVERSLDRFSKTILLDIVSRPGASLSVTREADKLLAEMQREREREREHEH